MSFGLWMFDVELNRALRPLRAVGHALSLIGVLCVSLAAQGQQPAPQMAEELPRELEGVGIFEKLNDTAPLDVPFKDENGEDVTLRDYLKPGAADHSHPRVLPVSDALQSHAQRTRRWIE